MWGMAGMPGPPNDNGGLKSVSCQTCGEEISQVHPDVIARRLATGEYTNKRFTFHKGYNGGSSYSEQEGVFGLCSKCRGINPVVRGGSGAQADAQARRIRDQVRLIRERRPDLTLKEATSAAIEYEFDPSRESNEAFRAYLLERGNSTPGEKFEGVRKWLKGLFGGEE